MAGRLPSSASHSLSPITIESSARRCCSFCSVKNDRTLAMIKLDGLSGNYTEKIKAAILDYGFHIAKETKVQLDDQWASLFCTEHSGRSFFVNLIKYIMRFMVLQPWRAREEKQPATSLAGTTIAGVQELKKDAFRGKLINDVAAAAKHCRELS